MPHGPHRAPPVAVLLALMSGAVGAAGADERVYLVDTLVAGLEHPWSIAFLPDGDKLVTERAGRLRIIRDDELLPDPVSGVPEAYVRSQAGLFEVLPHPGFETNRLLYLSFAHGTRRENTTRVVRGRYSDGALTDVEVIFDAAPRRNTPVHYGGRMAWLPDGTLLVGLGDGFDFREAAQDPGDHLGSVVRLNDDGAVPADNPFVGRDDIRPETFTFGHRNVQGVVHDPDHDIIWAHEHGPRGGDELNRLIPGRNYGWPVITYGVDYSGAKITPYTERPGMEQPLIDWTPSIAPAGLGRYTGEVFPEWHGDLLVAGLVSRAVHRIEIDDTGRPREVERLFNELGERLRDVRAGPDGLVYVLTDSREGRVLRVRRRP